jgi:hypothetical protein
MVSIENRVSYMERINESPKLKAFHYFLLDKEITSLPNNNVSETDEQFFKILSAIQTNNKTAFEEIYSRKNKSNPNKESPAPFVNDDYLIFCLIIAIIKFSINKTWIKNILSIRTRNITTVTLENILNENYSSTSNQAEVVLMYLQLCNQSKVNNDLLNTAYKSITENTALLKNRNDFQILCAFRAYDLIIEQKEATEGSEITLLRDFNTKFLKRIRMLSWLIQSAFFFLIFYLGFKIASTNDSVNAWINKFSSVLQVLSVLGLSQLGNLFPVVKRKSYEIMLRLFGYPSGLIEKLNKKENS